MSSFLPKKIYWGIVNPPGEDNKKSTYYFQKCQLPEVAKQLIGKPIKILHHHQDENGEHTPPSGVCVHAHVHPKTGALWAGFTLAPTPAGELAGVFLGEKPTLLPKDFHMGELSLGFDILQDTRTGDPHGHIIKELSICYAGARPGCEIKGSGLYSKFIPTPPPPNEEKNYMEKFNKYFSTIEKNKIENKMMKKLAPEEPISYGTRPQESQTFNDLLNVSIPVELSTIPAQASTITSQDETTKILEEVLQKTLNQETSLKRPREEDPPLGNIPKVDFSKFINAGEEEQWKDPVMPEGLPEATQEAWKQIYAEKKQLWERAQNEKKESRRKFLERLQGASDNIIPTYIQQCKRENKSFDPDVLAATMAAISEFHPQAADTFATFVEAQAKQSVSAKEMQKDINQLEQEYQAKVQKLTQENEELKKSQARPPLAPQKTISTPSPPQQPPTMYNLNTLPTIARVYAQASLNTNKKLGNIPGTQTPVELAIANGLHMQKLFDKYSPGCEHLTMGDLYGSTYKNIIKGGGVIPGLKDKWLNI